MSTSSNVGSIGGVTTYEDYQKKDLYAEPGSQDLGKDAFLRLLTTQLQHQDPLNPMDNTQFIAQLSQFSSLEQLTNANDKLESLAIGMSSVGNATMVNLIGKEVRAYGDGFQYDAGESKSLNYALAAAAEQVTVTIYDASGNVVLQKGLGAQEAGDNTFSWDGRNSNGIPMGSGDYRFTITASTGSTSIGSATYTQGLVDQVDFTTGVAAPRIDGQTITVDKIVQILESE